MRGLKRQTISSSSDFKRLDFKGITRAYGFKNTKLAGDVIYITSKHDEWYVRYDDRLDAPILHHRNTRHCTNRFHRENMRFHSVYDVFEYINYHDKKLLSFKEEEDIFTLLK